MKVLVSGSRTWENRMTVWSGIRRLWFWQMEFAERASRLGEFVVIHGACPDSPDEMADDWVAEMLRLDPTLAPELRPERMPAMWDVCEPLCPSNHRKRRRDGKLYCPTAGFRRNQAMVDLRPDRCLFFIRDRSPGATDCAERALAAGLEMTVKREAS